MARKGDKRHPGVHEDKILDMIFSERLGQSQKPEEIYCMVESVFPGGVPRVSANRWPACMHQAWIMQSLLLQCARVLLLPPA